MPVNALEEFKEFLKLIAPMLKVYGYSRRGQNFYTRRAGNWGVINFQKSQSSTREKVKFYVNLGIYSLQWKLSSALRRVSGFVNLAVYFSARRGDQNAALVASATVEHRLNRR